MSELAEKEILSDEYGNQIRTFGALNYTSERICQLLGLKKAKREALLYRITIPGGAIVPMRAKTTKDGVSTIAW